VGRDAVSNVDMTGGRVHSKLCIQTASHARIKTRAAVGVTKMLAGGDEHLCAHGGSHTLQLRRRNQLVRQGRLCTAAPAIAAALRLLLLQNVCALALELQAAALVTSRCQR